MMKIYVTTLLLLMLVLIWFCEAKGGRGGGGWRGGSRSLRSYRSSKYNARGWSSRTKLVALQAGTIYMTSRLHHTYYRASTHDYNDDIYEFDICRNTEIYRPRNATDKAYGWFLCPTSGYTKNEKYCCGDENHERCCSFWKSSKGTTRILTIVAILIGVIGIFLYVICKKPSVGRSLYKCFVSVICFPCNIVEKCIASTHRRRRRNSFHEPGESVETAEAITTLPVRPSDPPPPSYDECTKGLYQKEPDSSDLESNLDAELHSNHRASADNLHSSNHHIEPTAPLYARPPSPSFRSPSPPGRSSPVECSRNSISSNRS